MFPLNIEHCLYASLVSNLMAVEVARGLLDTCHTRA